MAGTCSSKKTADRLFSDDLFFSAHSNCVMKILESNFKEKTCPRHLTRSIVRTVSAAMSVHGDSSAVIRNGCNLLMQLNIPRDIDVSTAHTHRKTPLMIM
jgi:hypothetical protein